MNIKKNISVKAKFIFLAFLFIVLSESIYLISSQRNIKTDSLEVTLKKCATLNLDSEKLQCWEDLLDSTLKYQGIDKAFDIVESLYNTEATFASNCHGYVHIIGQKAYRLFSTHQDFNLSLKTSYCGYGFYHAFMESLLTSGGNLDEARQFCDYVDKKMGSTIADTKGACYHGIGHGVADNHDQKHWDSEEVLVGPALKLCEKVAPNDILLNRCSSGVFNVLAISYSSNRVNLNLQNPLSFCNQLSNNIYKRTCYEEMNTLLFSLSHGDFIQAAKFVEEIGDDNFANSGIRSLAGVFGMSLVKNTDFTNAIYDCRNLQERLRLSCIRGFVGGLIEAGQPHQEYVKALQFCADERLLSGDEKKACYQEFLWLSSQYYPEQKYQQICQSVDSKYRQNCNYN